jgi:RimJ/RimL family protein N-acetyltransferase
VPIGSLAFQEQPTLVAEGGLLLRPWVVGDAAAVREVYQDPAIQRWHVQRADSDAEAEEWIAGWQGEWPAEKGAHWAVVDRGSGLLLGRAALKAMNFWDGVAHVAYWTAPVARGEGVCPRAVEAMVAWAFDSCGFQRLDLDHATENTASCRVAEKTGFALESVRRSVWLLADGRHDAHLHTRLRPTRRQAGCSSG